MLRTLLSSNAPRPRRGGAAALSTMLHSALLAGAILATSHRRVVPVAVDPPALIRYQPPEVEHVQTVVNPEVGCCPETGAVVPTIDLPKFDMARVAPMDDVMKGLVDALAKPINFDSRVALGGRTVRADPGGAAYDVASVDKPVVELPGGPTPRYPDLFRQSGTEGRVTLSFVVDTLGRVEPNSVSTVASTHEAFEQAVRSVLLRRRFIPAEINGRHVRQLVQQEFLFTLRR